MSFLNRFFSGLYRDISTFENHALFWFENAHLSGSLGCYKVGMKKS